MSVEGFDPLALIPRFGSNVHEYAERGPGKRGCGKMMDLQPINTGDLISIAQFGVGITQCTLIWYGLAAMREGTRQRDKALDEIIAQGREGREALRKTMESLDKTLDRLDKSNEGLDKSNAALGKLLEGSPRSYESWEKLLEGSQRSNESLGKILEGSQRSNESLEKLFEGSQKSNEGWQKSIEGLQKSNEALAVLLQRTA